MFVQRPVNKVSSKRPSCADIPNESDAASDLATQEKKMSCHSKRKERRRSRSCHTREEDVVTRRGHDDAIMEERRNMVSETLPMTAVASKRTATGCGMFVLRPVNKESSKGPSCAVIPNESDAAPDLATQEKKMIDSFDCALYDTRWGGPTVVSEGPTVVSEAEEKAHVNTNNLVL
jgi:hypothetical protein